MRKLDDAFLNIAILLVVFAFLDWWLRGITQLPAKSYETAFLFIAFTKHLSTLGWRLGPIALILLSMVAGYRTFGCRWSDFQNSQAIRVLVLAAASLLAWIFSTYDYNLYFDQSHMLDRILIILLLVATIWRPFFVLPFLFVLLPVISQFAVPLGGFTWSVPYLPVRILILFAAMLLIRLVTRSRTTSHFAFAVCCLVAAHYWPSGLGKLQLGWLANDQVYFLLPSTYANGWLGFLEPKTIAALTHMASVANLPIKVVTLALEVGALLFLWRRSLMIVILCGWLVLHVGIFCASGICFWPWAVVDAAFLFIAWKYPVFFEGLFTTSRFLVSLVVIVSVPLWLRPVKLSWLDTRATYTYRFEAVSERGERFWLPPYFFEPYAYEFTLSMFSYLSQQPILPITWGATKDQQVAERLRQAASAEDVVSVEQELGQDLYRPERVKTLENFLVRFVGNYNQRKPRKTWLSYLRAPPYLWTFTRSHSSAVPQRIARVKAHQILSFYNGEEYVEVRSTPVLEISVPPPVSPK